MVLAAAVQVGTHRDQHVRSRHADQPHVVAEDLVLAPLLERLVDAERVAEVDGAAEHLLGAVEPVRRAQLLAAQHAQRLEQLGADLVLAAVASGGRGQNHAQPLPVALPGQQRVVLVVGMRGDVHHRAGDGELAEDQLQAHQAPLVGDGAGRRGC